MKPLRLKTHYFHSKLLCQKPMLRQREWRLQNGPITKSVVLPVTALFFLKIYFSFRTYQEDLIWCTNDLNAHIRIFRKQWNLILGCFFPVSILKCIKPGRFYLTRDMTNLSPFIQGSLKWPFTELFSANVSLMHQYIAFKIFLYRVLIILHKMLMITGIFNEKTNELTMYGKLGLMILPTRTSFFISRIEISRKNWKRAGLQN